MYLPLATVSTAWALVLSEYAPVVTVTVASPSPDIGDTLVSQLGLEEGSVMVHAPAQLTWKVVLWPASYETEPFEGESETDELAGPERATDTLFVLVLTVRKPLLGLSPAVTVTVPLLLPLVGLAVKPAGAETVQLAFEVMLIVAEAFGLSCRTSGETLRVSASGLSLCPPQEDIAIEKTKSKTGMSTVSRAKVLNVIIISQLQYHARPGT